MKFAKDREGRTIMSDPDRELRKKIDKAVDLARDIKRLERDLDKLRDEILVEHVRNEAYRIETDRHNSVMIAADTQSKLDSKRLKAELPDVFKEYVKEVPTRAHVKIS